MDDDGRWRIGVVQTITTLHHSQVAFTVPCWVFPGVVVVWVDGVGRRITTAHHSQVAFTVPCWVVPAVVVLGFFGTVFFVVFLSFFLTPPPFVCLTGPRLWSALQLQPCQRPF